MQPDWTQVSSPEQCLPLCPAAGILSYKEPYLILLWASQVVLVVKNPPANAGDIRDVCSIPGSGRSPGGGHGQPTPVFLPEKSHGQRSLAGYSPRGCNKARHDLVTRQQQQIPSGANYAFFSLILIY